MEPFVWRMKLAYNTSLEQMIKRFEGKRCLMCGKRLEKRIRPGRYRRFCDDKCKWLYKEFEKTRKQIIVLEKESESSQELGTIFIRPKLENETWEQYHQYLQSLKAWIAND